MKQLKNILYVEDNSDDRFFMRYTVKKISPAIDIHEIDNGEDALDELDSRGQEYDLIFLDIKLPKLTCFEILSQLNHKLEQITPQIVVLTTSSSTHDKNQAESFNIDTFITKPINEQILRDIIRNRGMELPA